MTTRMRLSGQSFRLASTLALALGLAHLGIRASAAIELEFKPPEIRDVDIHGEGLKAPEGLRGPEGTGGHTAPPPDIIGSTKPNAAPHEVPNSNIGKIKEGAAPPKPMGEGSAPRTGDAGPRDAPSQEPKQATLREEPKTEPKTEPKNEPKNEAKNEPTGDKAAGKADPKEKPSFFKKHREQIAIMGAFISLGVVLPVAVQAIDASLPQQPDPDQGQQQQQQNQQQQNQQQGNQNRNNQNNRNRNNNQ